MKLTRITKLKYRVFRDFVWPSELHSFAQFNVVYGWNGCGKTTLSSLLSLVEKKTALPKEEGELELEFNGTTKVTGAKLATKPVPQVRVFNRDFINSTLQSAGGIAPIYFLGEDSVEKQKEVDQLKRDLDSVNDEVMNAQNKETKAANALDEFCKDKAKLIKELLTGANSQTYNNYNKAKFKEATERLNAESATVAMLTDEQKTSLRSQKDAQPKANIEKVAEPSVDIATLTREVDALVARSVVAQTLDELTSHAKLAAWVQQGLALHSGEHASDTCRFCLQPLDAARRAALEAHFNDAFASFQKDVGALLAKLNAAKRSAGSLTLPDASRFYEALTAEVTAASAQVTTARSETESALDALIAQVEAKRDNPFAPAASVPPAASMPAALTAVVAALNALIERHNQTSAQFKASVDEACKKLEASYLAEAHAEFLQLSGAVTTANSALETIKSKPAGIQAQISELERAILEHRRPADELTEELRAYLGRDELRFEVKGNGYALTRNGQPVAHLSEGERTAISFLYFLKSLQDKTFDMAKGIVVIDDPVSSLDANALFSAFGYMKERTKQAGQLFIFTHSFPFFRLVRNWFHHLPKQRSPQVDRRLGRFFLLRPRRHTDGSRTSHLGPLDPLLQEHESEYQYLFKRVYDEAHRTDIVSLEHHYGLPNVARRLIEAFLAFRFPEMSGDLGPRLDRVVDTYNYDTAKKTRVLRLLNTYSHAGAIADPEHDLSLLAETQPVLLDVLELMKTVDKDHYDGLEKLVAPPLGVLAAGSSNGVE
ncbi:MAG: AAA family ATPase [Polyangiaceae bacterium]|nr:AAA family ATPase [Polyangiaceae bacterium]MCW5788847.1 AAA family ATPase [Polyangiaceae bacterium]